MGWAIPRISGTQGHLEAIRIDPVLEHLATIKDTHGHLVAELFRPGLILVDVSHLDVERHSAAKLVELYLRDVAEMAASTGVEDQRHASFPW